MKRILVAPVATLLLIGGILTPVLAATPPTSPVMAAQKTAPSAEIDGFRSAKFGMDEAQIRSAIAADFSQSDVQIARSTQPMEKTTVLSIKVDNLLPDIGPAQVSYVLGFRSHKLIQVNVIWPQGKGNAVAAAAMTLRDYFRALPLDPEKVVLDGKMPDGSILAFRGADTRGRMVLEIFSPAHQEEEQTADKSAKKTKAEKKPAEKNKTEKTAENHPDILRLIYIETPEKPDTFRLNPGEF